ncbi:23S rRNA (pseudouridine(1915)-N(3))-methyltransferase RlmH [Rubellimicrobium rubrum]|uniref:Ribosomal RNA large subunit methyltransferase H n=1 Tax=Rubellimicrobium rubrum TaxID=2585369 RepID=A0A5C4N0A4_9RHOB|nr:23S rRNA (pseudouridine(1915)-N(3))-methyltransferase RlmH [Rubellimicrobium rubrum]TNC51502.1 23S rRNA (pseudouridine(1915)-N(3))-methyltransferase RlmH [Rubellimicrobium rubrum]
MRMTILAVGRLRAGPEKELLDDFLLRFDRTGRALGLGPASVVEIEAKPGAGMAAEGPLLLGRVPKDAWLCCLDERGELLPSPAFATRLDRWKTERRDAVFVIGGADGLDPSVTGRADLLLSLGPMVWPHMLVRVMLSEQLYRAATILAGTPYHRT